MPRRRLAIAVTALLFSAGLLLHTLLDSDGWTRRQRVRRDLDALKAQNETIEAHVTDLRAQIKGMRTRPEVQERAVRDELGYARPGEVILDVTPASGESAGTRPPSFTQLQ